MVLLLLFIIAIFTTGIIAAVIGNGWSRSEDAAVASFACFVILGIPFAITQVVGLVKDSRTQNISYSQKIVSINDGTGIQGSISGGLFLIRGQIGDTQHFSYYMQSGASYTLQKRDATQSTIYTDATSDTASVVITDSVSSCTPKWWHICPGSSARFVHADFHVPQNSIKQDYVLDAQ